MFKKYLFVLIALVALCAWGIAPNWSEASARSLNQSIPIEGTAPEDAPTNPNAAIPADGNNGVNGPPTLESDDDLEINIRPSASIFTRGGLFAFIIQIINRSQNAVENVVVRFIVPAFTTFPIPGVQSAAVGDFTCQNGGVAGDVCAYELADELASGAEESVEVSLMIPEDYPNNGIDPLTLAARVDAANLTGGIYNTARSSATVVDELPDLNEESVPAAGDEDAPTGVTPADPNSEDAPPATVDSESGTVSVPVVFENKSDKAVDNVIITAQLPMSATLPAGSPWTCDETNNCVQNIGTVQPGQVVNVPFVYIGENVTAGTQVDIPTRIDGQQTNDDGTVTPIAIRNTISVEVEDAPIVNVPTGLEDTDEPSQDQKLFLPLIQTN